MENGRKKNGKLPWQEQPDHIPKRQRKIRGKPGRGRPREEWKEVKGEERKKKRKAKEKKKQKKRKKRQISFHQLAQQK